MLLWTFTALAAPRAESSWFLGVGAGVSENGAGGLLAAGAPFRGGWVLGPHLLAEAEITGAYGSGSVPYAFLANEWEMATATARGGLTWFPWSRGGTWLRLATGPGFLRHSVLAGSEVFVDQGLGLDVAAGVGQEVPIGHTLALGAEGVFSALIRSPVVPMVTVVATVRVYVP